MQIERIVEQIIARRNQRLPGIERKKEELYRMLELLDEFEGLKSEIVDTQGNVIDGKFRVMADKNPEMPIKLYVLSSAECKKKIKAALEECDAAANRFGRDSINIAVVGQARIGKSRLLQSISNLSSKVIPDSSDSDCTGAVSVIKNRPGTKLEAHLRFKTEDQIIAAVQGYVDAILSHDERIVIRSLNQIRDLDIRAIREKVPFGAPEAIKIPYLEKYVLGFGDWSPLIREKELVLTNENEIQQYVAQHNGTGESKHGEKKYFYKYLAVDSCEIYCTYDYGEAGKITLIDTVGLNDNARGLIDDVVNVIRDKSDAVIFLLFPLSLAGGGISNDITSIYQKIAESCPQKNLDKWLSWLINYAPNHPTTPNPYKYCEKTMDTLVNRAGWSGEVKRIVDISDQTQVREEFLIPLLNTLMSNLDKIDDLYLEDLKSALSDAQKEFTSFCSAAKKLMSSRLGSASNMHPRMIVETDKMFNKLTAKLKSLADKEKEKRDVSCDVLKNRVIGIIESLKDGSLIPSTKDLREELSCSQPQTVYINCCNKLRTEVTQKFSDVDGSLKELVNTTKNSIANILISDEGCRLGRILNPSNEPYEWLKTFADTILDEDVYENLFPAFNNVYSFDLSVKGFLTYEVRACLDELDPELTDIPKLLGTTELETVDNIAFWLERKLIDISDELYENLSTLFKKPHRAFFAIIKEFSDKVIYADNVKYEWNRLFMENFTVIWAEDYKKMAIEAASFEEWSELLKKLLEFNSKSEAFVI